MSKRMIALLGFLMLILVGCRQEEALSSEDINIALAFEPADLAVTGDSTVLVTVTDNDGNAINDATVTIRGDMSHAGMAPVIRDVETGEEGVFSTDYEWTMAGDWEVSVTVTLPDGTSAGETFAFTVEGDMSDMGMEDMNMSGAVSGGYLSISNNGSSDIMLMSVVADGVGMIEIHETVVENDIASMQAVENGELLIAAGETVMLQPGSFHLMLMNLENDLVEGETLSLSLTFDNDETLIVDAIIQGEAPEAPEASEVIESGDIVISGAWVRPTALSDMGGMDMDGTEEADMGGMDMDDAEEADMGGMDMDGTEEASE
ncbi:MAG: copper chaperone PCu(A)C [Anaerolineae bacterium]|nr:copper chaperone PCu(A)C [Anaerolineae bacterium]